MVLHCQLGLNHDIFFMNPFILSQFLSLKNMTDVADTETVSG